MFRFHNNDEFDEMLCKLDSTEFHCIRTFVLNKTQPCELRTERVRELRGSTEVRLDCACTEQQSHNTSGQGLQHATQLSGVIETLLIAISHRLCNVIVARCHRCCSSVLYHQFPILVNVMI